MGDATGQQNFQGTAAVYHGISKIGIRFVEERRKELRETESAGGKGRRKRGEEESPIPIRAKKKRYAIHKVSN
jgi:hypothetical protein